MNFVYLLAMCLALLSCFSAAAWVKPTGQPGCQTEQEIAVGNYRHFYKKNVYWRCTTLGTPAALVICPNGQGYLDDAKSCVPYSQWYWTPTVLPPTQA